MASSPKWWTLIAEYLQVASSSRFSSSFSLLIFPTKMTTVPAFYLHRTVNYCLFSQSLVYNLILITLLSWPTRIECSIKLISASYSHSSESWRHQFPCSQKLVLFPLSTQSKILESFNRIRLHGTIIFKTNWLRLGKLFNS